MLGRCASSCSAITNNYQPLPLSREKPSVSRWKLDCQHILSVIAILIQATIIAGVSRCVDDATLAVWVTPGLEQLAAPITSLPFQIQNNVYSRGGLLLSGEDYYYQGMMTSTSTWLGCLPLAGSSHGL